jgi:hypothetical protein
MKYVIEMVPDDIQTKFYKDQFRRSEIVRGEYTCMHTVTYRQQGDLISLLLVFKTKKVA